MSYVLGKYADKDGQSDFFQVSETGYDELQIERIKDPDGGKRTEMPTAVPSPFARFDLVQTAFKNITKNEQLTADRGEDIKAGKFDERIVSHTLDLAEYIFDSQARGGKLEILTWRKSGDANHIDELKKSSSKKHRDFAESLSLYLSQDAETYNFDDMKKIFIFKYGRDVIGCTSPVTLFCPSAADLSKLDIRCMAERRVAFGEESLPLYKRTPDFQRWFYYLLALCKSNLPDAVKKNLSCMFDYAEKSLRQSDTFADIYAGKPTVADFENEYYQLNTGGGNTPVDILGIGLCVGKPSAIEDDLLKSDFVIKAGKNYTDTRLPLVLQNGFSKTGWAYLRTTSFMPSIAVEAKVDTPFMEKRDMPGFSDIKGYYLTVGDFLEPYIVRTLYPISDRFYTGGCRADKDSKGYMLPLSLDFFRFFSIKDLMDGETDPQKPKLAITPQNNGDVKVTLRIPVGPLDKEGKRAYKGDIIFDRTYKNRGLNQTPDEKSPDGGMIVDVKVGTTIFPFVKVGDYANIKYRVQLVDSDAHLQHRDYELEFYSQDAVTQNLSAGYKRRFNKKDSTEKYDSTSDYYKIKGEFDLIQLKINNPHIKALIVPKWPTYSRSSKFTFAVDFGNTNTYVAYKVNEDIEPSAFELRDAIATLYDETGSELNIRGGGADNIIDLIDREFVPRRIGKRDSKDDNIFIFPQRTAIAYNEDIRDEDWDDGDGLDTLQEGNIPFGYEKTAQFGNIIATTLKWSGSEHAGKQMAAYLEEIIMLIQAKVLSENGKLSETRLIWFYPSSMGRGQRTTLEKTWNAYFSDYFFKGERVPSGHLVSVRESLAPFFAEKDKKDFLGGAVVSIDIGGGTTDVAVFQDAKLRATTSFKFAGDVLFGDGYAAQAADKNGFVLRFADYFADKLKDYPKPRDILNDLRNPKRAKASDINAFLFSVEKSIDFWAKGKDISRKMRADLSYTEQLHQCDDLKFLILYFYMAVIYHISKVLKHENLMEDGKPIAVQYLMFSGTASKMLTILSGGSEENLNDFTQKAFKDLGLEHRNLEVILVKDPKEVTCNGGLRANIVDIENASKESKSADSIIYTCIKDREYDKSLRYSDYRDGLECIKRELVDFHKFFFKLNDDKSYSFEEFFCISKSVTALAKNALDENNGKISIDRLLKDSIGRNQPIDEERQPVNDEITETSFFMPLKSIILELSEQIVKMTR
ncbi:MAG: hypothetical protein FWC23_01140 [Chitinispirillia bacterium]|nr:hypothetical protein [Chitinispirillia bacterium]MCL2267781.1 hypothetical protein [Chitinispirillia bacterium]